MDIQDIQSEGHEKAIGIDEKSRTNHDGQPGNHCFFQPPKDFCSNMFA